MTWIIPPVRGLIDPNCAPTYSIDDIGAIWLEGGEATTYYYHRMPCLHGGEDQMITDVIIKRRGIGLVSSFMKVATFSHQFMMGWHEEPTIQPHPPRPGAPQRPRLVE